MNYYPPGTMDSARELQYLAQAQAAAAAQAQANAQVQPPPVSADVMAAVQQAGVQAQTSEFNLVGMALPELLNGINSALLNDFKMDAPEVFSALLKQEVRATASAVAAAAGNVPADSAAPQDELYNGFLGDVPSDVAADPPASAINPTPAAGFRVGQKRTKGDERVAAAEAAAMQQQQRGAPMPARPQLQRAQRRGDGSGNGNGVAWPAPMPDAAAAAVAAAAAAEAAAMQQTPSVVKQEMSHAMANPQFGVQMDAIKGIQSVGADSPSGSSSALPSPTLPPGPPHGLGLRAMDGSDGVDYDGCGFEGGEENVEVKKAMRAERNRQSAAASRERKKHHIKELERRVTMLSQENAQLQVGQLDTIRNRIAKERKLLRENKTLKREVIIRDMRIEALTRELETHRIDDTPALKRPSTWSAGEWHKKNPSKAADVEEDGKPPAGTG